MSLTVVIFVTALRVFLSLTVVTCLVFISSRSTSCIFLVKVFQTVLDKHRFCAVLLNEIFLFFQFTVFQFSSHSYSS